jgi:hypothetical protein
MLGNQNDGDPHRRRRPVVVGRPLGEGGPKRMNFVMVGSNQSPKPYESLYFVGLNATRLTDLDQGYRW